MTDKIKGFVVTLRHPLRADDAEAIKNAISMINGVADVSASVHTPDDYMNRMAVKSELLKKLYEVFE